MMSPEAAYSKIIDSLSEYLMVYGLYEEVAFIYNGDIRDVDILQPLFDRKIYQDIEDVETVIRLLDKQSIEIPQTVIRRKHALQKLIEQRTSIRQFENWLIGFITYLDIGELEVEVIYYSPIKGFIVKFEGVETVFRGRIVDTATYDIVNSRTRKKI